ncbi:MAG: serine hydroxymethyltransferase [Candidatus Omnitrophota bacterium]
MCNFSYLKDVDPEVFEIIKREILRQHKNIELIASENFASLSVLEAQGSVLTNKYAEGYPSARWYGGCENVDDVEVLAIKRAKKIFKAEHANVQPHSGTQANMAVYLAALKYGDTVLAMDLACGGHLSHGLSHNFSGMSYKFVYYGVNKDTEMLDYNEIEQLAKKHKPKMILAGASAYPRLIDFEKFKKIADLVGAYLFVDMAHFAGLVVAGVHPSPIPYADFVTATTHKTLRGPRGGLIFCKKEYAKKIDSIVFPGLQGGPLMHVIAAKAVALKEATSERFNVYQKQVAENAKALAKSLGKLGFRIVSGDTDTHLLLVDLRSKNITGKNAAHWLDKAQITANKNLIPFDTEHPSVTSGLRLGTPAVTTRGMKTKQMEIIAALINRVISASNKDAEVVKVAKEVDKITGEFPLYPELWKE